MIILNISSVLIFFLPVFIKIKKPINKQLIINNFPYCLPAGSLKLVQIL